MHPALQKTHEWIRSRRWPLLLALLPFAYVAAVVLPHPFGMGLQHGNDFQGHRIWWTDLATWYLKQGFVPLWTPSLDFGTVFFGHFGHAFFYAPGWWQHVFHAPVIPALQTGSQYLQICLHMAVALLGVYTLLRRRGGVCEPAAALGASLLLINHRFHDFVRYPDSIEAMAWIPWMLVVGLRMVEGSGKPSGKAGGLTSDFLKLTLLTGLSWTAGYGQLTYTGGLMIALVLAGVARDVKRLATAAGAAVLGTVLAAGPLVPTAVMAKLSPERGGGNFAFATQHPLNVTFAEMFSHPFSANVHASSYFPPAFLGLVACGLAVSWGRDRRRLSAALLAGACLMIDLSRGADGWLCRAAYDHLPMYSAFRVQSRINWITLLALCWFAGLGAQQALRGGKRARWIALGLVLGIPLLAGLHHVFVREPDLAGLSPAEMGGMSAGLREYSFWMLLAGSTLLLGLAAGLRNGRVRALAMIGTVWVFMFFFGRHSTWYRQPPSLKVHPSFAGGMMAPFRLGDGVTSQCLVQDVHGELFHEYQRLTAAAPRRFPATRFCFVPDDPAATPEVTLTMESYGPNHVRAKARTSAAGRLVFFNSMFPGWKGSPVPEAAPAPFQRFMSFRLPAGETGITLSFAPIWMMACGLATLLGLPAVATALALRLGRRNLAAAAACFGLLSTAFFLYGSYTRRSLSDRALYGLDGSTLDPAARVPVVMSLEHPPGAP